MITKRELFEMLAKVNDDDRIRVDAIIECGRGVSGDSDSDISVDHNGEEWVLNVSGDESSDTGYYD